MGIYFDDEKRIFTLETRATTYQIKADKYGFLLHLYYGSRIKGDMEYLLTYYDRGFSGVPYDAGMDRTYSMDVLPQEFPCRGTGDFRSTALDVRNADGTYSCDLRYKEYRILDGKYGLEGLPAVYADEREAQTLEIILRDAVTGVEAVLIYGVLPELDIITRSVRIKNAGNKKIWLEKVQSACLDFVTGDYDVISFYGRHAMERNYQRTAVAHGSQAVGSRRGASSHQYNPLLLLAASDTTETAGSCYAMSFVYSGAFQAEAGKDQFDQTRMLMGLQSEMFSYPLEAGEEFTAPEVILTYTDQGLNQLSQKLHRCIRTHVCRGQYRDIKRPVLINSWEANYFDFDGDSLCRLAESAKELGIEMLVLDDGWFGKRCDDNRALGDWDVNEEKLGCTMGELVKRVNDIGLKFGIWIEPEAISIESELYRAHPDWALQIPGRNPVRSRNQLVLDFSRKEVVDYIYEQITKVLDQGNIEYIKWDMNRSLSDVYSPSAENQGQVYYDYVLGLYDFLERLHRDYPHILVEGCSGGGGRFDAGMMYYTPQIWCSDNTDAADRVLIQYGTSFGYPVSAVGSHVSAVPNHQTGRTIPMKTRGITAMAGTFGYELDLDKLTEEEKEEVRSQVEEYKKYADLIRLGDYYRLSNPFEENTAAWAFVSENREEVLLNAVTQQIHANMGVSYVRLQGLEADRFYREEKSGAVYSGSALMAAGIPIPIGSGEYPACQMYFKMV